MHRLAATRTTSQVRRYNSRADSRDTRISHVSYETYVHERIVFSISRVGVLRWQPSGWTCSHGEELAKNTALTAKNVAHSVVKGTRKAVHTVVYTFTP
jgi:hypothetical protein